MRLYQQLCLIGVPLLGTTSGPARADSTAVFDAATKTFQPGVPSTVRAGSTLTLKIVHVNTFTHKYSAKGETLDFHNAAPPGALASLLLITKPGAGTIDSPNKMTLASSTVTQPLPEPFRTAFNNYAAASDAFSADVVDPTRYDTSLGQKVAIDLEAGPYNTDIRRAVVSHLAAYPLFQTDVPEVLTGLKTQFAKPDSLASAEEGDAYEMNIGGDIQTRILDPLATQADDQLARENREQALVSVQQQQWAVLYNAWKRAMATNKQMKDVVGALDEPLRKQVLVALNAAYTAELAAVRGENSKTESDALLKNPSAKQAEALAAMDPAPARIKNPKTPADALTNIRADFLDQLRVKHAQETINAAAMDVSRLYVASLPESMFQSEAEARALGDLDAAITAANTVITDGFTAATTLLGARADQIKPISDNLHATAQVARLCLDPDTAPGVIDKPFAIGGEIDLVQLDVTVDTVPNPLSVVPAPDPKSPAGTVLANNPPQEETRTRAFAVAGRLAHDFSIGVATTDLHKRNFYIGTEQADPTKTGVFLGASDKHDTGAVALAHFYYTTSLPLGLSLGPCLGVTTADPSRYLVGGSLVAHLGRRFRLYYSYGAAYGKTTQLTGVGLDPNAPAPLDPTKSLSSPPTTDVNRWGHFSAVTLSLSF